MTLLEPGAYATEFGSDASRKDADGLEAYAELRKRVFQGLANHDRGDPKATGSRAQGRDADAPPLRFATGSTVLPSARATYADRLATWEAWGAVSNAAQGEPAKGTVASLWRPHHDDHSCA